MLKVWTISKLSALRYIFCVRRFFQTQIVAYLAWFGQISQLEKVPVSMSLHFAVGKKRLVQKTPDRLCPERANAEILKLVFVTKNRFGPMTEEAWC